MALFGKKQNKNENENKNLEEKITKEEKSAAEEIKAEDESREEAKKFAEMQLEKQMEAQAKREELEKMAKEIAKNGLTEEQRKLLEEKQISAQNNAAAKTQYATPEGFDFNKYFMPERHIILENVSYETGRPTPGQLKLGAKDTIIAQLALPAGVKVTFNRTLKFEPDGPFTLSVSFAVMLVFNPKTRDEVDWKTIDIAEQFKKNCPSLVSQMMAKSALLVGEITAANGGAPIIPMR